MNNWKGMQESILQGQLPQPLSHRFEEQAGEESAVMYRWFEEVGYDADIEALREMRPEMKRLEPFLREQEWGRAGIGA